MYESGDKSGDKSGMSNYTGITFGSVFATLFAMILEHRLSAWAESQPRGRQDSEKLQPTTFSFYGH